MKKTAIFLLLSIFGTIAQADRVDIPCAEYAALTQKSMDCNDFPVLKIKQAQYDSLIAQKQINDCVVTAKNKHQDQGCPANIPLWLGDNPTACEKDVFACQPPSKQEIMQPTEQPVRIWD
jgi:hypothetical protein